MNEWEGKSAWESHLPRGRSSCQLPGAVRPAVPGSIPWASPGVGLSALSTLCPSEGANVPSGQSLLLFLCKSAAILWALLFLRGSQDAQRLQVTAFCRTPERALLSGGAGTQGAGSRGHGTLRTQTWPRRGPPPLPTSPRPAAGPGRQPSPASRGKGPAPAAQPGPARSQSALWEM